MLFDHLLNSNIFITKKQIDKYEGPDRNEALQKSVLQTHSAALE